MDLETEDQHGTHGQIRTDIVSLRFRTWGPERWVDITDTDELRKLYEAIGDLLYAKTGVR